MAPSLAMTPLPDVKMVNLLVSGSGPGEARKLLLRTLRRGRARGTYSAPYPVFACGATVADAAEAHRAASAAAAGLGVIHALAGIVILGDVSDPEQVVADAQRMFPCHISMIEAEALTVRLAAGEPILLVSLQDRPL